MRITPERLGQAERFFARHGGKAVFLAWFVAGLRVFGALVAGISRMPWGTFLFYNALGGALWAAAAVLVGYLLGGSLDLVVQWAGRTSLLLLVLFGVVLAFSVAYRWVAGHRTRLLEYASDALSYPSVVRLRSRYDRQLLWVPRRLTPGQYLGLHLTAGLLAAAGCLWLFGGVAEDIVNSDPLVRFDLAVANVLHDLATPPLTTFFLIVTALGSIVTIARVGLIGAVVFGVRRRWLHLGTWLAAVAGSAALNQLLKAFFGRLRPYFEHPPSVGDLLQLPERSCDGVVGPVRDASLLRRAYPKYLAFKNGPRCTFSTPGSNPPSTNSTRKGQTCPCVNVAGSLSHSQTRPSSNGAANERR